MALVSPTVKLMHLQVVELRRTMQTSHGFHLNESYCLNFHRYTCVCISHWTTVDSSDWSTVQRELDM